MTILKSPLKLLEFSVLNSEYEFHQPKISEINPKDLFDNYELDFDFVIRTIDTGENFIFTKIKINSIKNPLPGYVMFVEAVSVFGFNSDTKLSEKEKDELLFISGLSIAINNLRTYISNTTCYFPMSRFDLPIFDVNDILNQKREKLNKK